MYFFPFSQKDTASISNSILPKPLLDGIGNKIMIAQSGVYSPLSLPTVFLQQAVHTQFREKCLMAITFLTLGSHNEKLLDITGRFTVHLILFQN